MTPVLDSLTAAVTPAVMVSACGLLALGLDNQTARMANRLRDMTREFRDLANDLSRQPIVGEQIRILGRRHGLYVTALVLNYAALFSFLLTSLLFLTLGFLQLPAGVPVVTFGLGVILLGSMAVVVLASLRLSRSAIRLEEEHTLGRPPTGKPTA